MADWQWFGYNFLLMMADIFSSPINIVLLFVCIFLVYKIRKHKSPLEEDIASPRPSLSKLKKDMHLTELKDFDGKNTDGRILVAVNGKVFDVTSNGTDLYGPGAPYAMFAGQDASRGLATFSTELKSIRSQYDDLFDLNIDQMERLKEWEIQFSEKYSYVGKLLRPDEVVTHVSDLESESNAEEEECATKADIYPKSHGDVFKTRYH